MNLYKMLGADEGLIDWWYTCHCTWYWKSEMQSGTLSEMRLTGQATTALGNAIVNLIAHRELIERNYDIMQLVWILGDDFFAAMSEYPSMKGVVENIRVKYNMINTYEIKDDVTRYCQFMVYRNGDTMEYGPDYIRMRNRYEVTNGVSEINSLNFQMRKMSCLSILGETNETKQIVKD